MKPHLLSSLCYFSVFFAGIIYPLLVFFVAHDPYIKYHARRALPSHVIPYLFIFLPPLFGLIMVFVIIWNIVMGIRVLREGKVF